MPTKLLSSVAAPEALLDDLGYKAPKLKQSWGWRAPPQDRPAPKKTAKAAAPSEGDESSKHDSDAKDAARFLSRSDGSPIQNIGRMMLMMADWVCLQVPDINGSSKHVFLATKKLHVTGLGDLGIELFSTGPHASGGTGSKSTGLSHRREKVFASPIAIEPGVSGKAPAVCHMPWSNRYGGSVVSVLCSPTPVCTRKGCKCIGSDPRNIAREQLRRLRNKGFSLRSAFEPQFQVLSDDDTGRKRARSMSPHQMQSLQTQLSEAGIPVQSILEDDYGRVSVEVQDMEGLDAADAAFRLKHGVRELTRKAGAPATFLTCPSTSSRGSRMAFQHALEPVQPGGSLPQMISSTRDLNTMARHWMGGLQAHGEAMAALCAPTVNCYRHLQDSVHGVPYLTWSFEERAAMVQVCPGDYNDEAMFKNMISCSAANPYLVMAATVAAGLDGITRQIEPLKAPWNAQGDDTAALNTPRTLRDALEALRQDTVMTEALGPSFMEDFMHLKGMEIDAMSPASDDDRQIAREREVYLSYL